MRFGVFTRPNAPWQEPWTGAFYDGLVQHGESAARYSAQRYRPCDVAVVWGLSHPWLSQHAAAGGRLLVLERGYVDRERYSAAGWDGINGRADFRLDRPLDGRLERLGWELLPWQRTTEGVCLIAGQVRGDNSVAHLDLPTAYQALVTELRAMVPREIVFRPHPLSRSEGWKLGVPISRRSLGEDLAEAYCVVTLNSNFGVDAVMAGVPTVALDRGSMVWDVAGHSVGDAVFPLRPDRSQWAQRLAHCQWTEDEMRSGETWEHLR